MAYPTLMRAWGLLLEDNIAAQIRPATESSFEEMLPQLMLRFDATDLQQAEDALASLEPLDLENLCMGEEDDQEIAISRMTRNGYFGVHANEVVAEMWELL